MEKAIENDPHPGFPQGKIQGKGEDEGKGKKGEGKGLTDREEAIGGEELEFEQFHEGDEGKDWAHALSSSALSRASKVVKG